MFKKLLNKLISVGIVASIILSGLVVFALPVLADSYNAYPDTGQYVYEKSVGGTKLAAGNLLQIIYAKGLKPLPPKSDGSPGGADALIDSTARTVGNIGGAGYFYYALNGLTNGNTVYIRVWNASTLKAATHYGDSAPLKIGNPLPNPPSAWAIKSFATSKPKPVTGPSIKSVSPSSGKQGETIAKVTIEGSGTTFTSNSKVTFGSGITSGTVKLLNALKLEVSNVKIASDAAPGKRDVTVDSVIGKNMFEVKAPTAATSIVIDDYEGATKSVSGSVTFPSGKVSSYYAIGPTKSNEPTVLRQTSVAKKDTYAMKTSYSANSDPKTSYRGWGGILVATQDASSVDTLTFWLKGDGSTNKVKFQVKDADGTNFGLTDANAVSLSSTDWKEVKISSFKTKMSRVVGTTSGDATLNWNKIDQYQFVFAGTAASTGVYIDHVVVSKGSTIPPVTGNPKIDKISKSKGKAGIEVTITGTGFGTAGKIEFAGTDAKAYIESLSTKQISAWSATGITFKVPDIKKGKKQLSVIRTSDSLQSNAVSFEVSASAAAASYNYPNPFNPSGSETTKIVFDSGTNTTATIYIFDTTAQMVEKLNWSGTAGANEVSWNGKNAFGEVLGDGVYLYRVAAGSSILGRGKILIINK